MSNDDEDETRRTEALGPDLHPEVRLLIQQLQSSVPNNFGRDLRQSLVKGTIKFYDGFKAKDRLETLLIRHIVILNNLATECFQRGINASKPEARAVDLRSGLKAVALITELCRLLEGRRQRDQQNKNGAAGLATLSPTERENVKASSKKSSKAA